jgi:hypothetical protein
MTGTATMTKPRRVIPERLTAAPLTETARVSHPRLEGDYTPHIETVRRVVDTLAVMLRRKHLREREYLAGDHYRTCFETLYGATGGALDFDRPRGGSTPGQPPAPHYMLASEVVRNVTKFLYPKDFAVVHRVCALGMSIEQAAGQLYDPVTRATKEDCGRRLREGLSQMADWWYPENRGRGGNMRSFSTERAMPTEAETVEAGKVHLGGTRSKT